MISKETQHAWEQPVHYHCYQIVQIKLKKRMKSYQLAIK